MQNVKRLLVVTALLAATTAYAQAPYEYDRASGGEIHMLTKGTRSTSGTLGLKRGDGTELWNATFGGTLLQDRVWFFGAFEKSENRMFVESPGGVPAAGQPQGLATMAVPSANYAGKAEFRINDRQRLDASAIKSTTLDIPSNFLSLRYTGIVTNNMFFTASFSHTKVDGSRAFMPVQ